MFDNKRNNQACVTSPSPGNQVDGCGGKKGEGEGQAERATNTSNGQQTEAPHERDVVGAEIFCVQPLLLGGFPFLSWLFVVFFGFCLACSALRVSRAETRLTVYRAP